MTSPTIVHAAVRHGDLQTVRMLLNAPIGIFVVDDLEAESPDGLTIEEHVQKRMNEELMECFPEAIVLLIEKVTAPDDVGGNDTVSAAVGNAGKDVEDDNEVWNGGRMNE